MFVKNTLRIVHYALCIAHSTLCTVHRALCVVPVHCDMCIVHYTVHWALCVAYCALGIVLDEGGRPKAVSFLASLLASQ